MRPRLLPLAAAIAAIAPLSSIALAADPENGKVTPGTKVAWTGEVTAPYAVWLQWFQNDGEGECSDPACDSFALEVAGGPANVTLRMKATSPDPAQEAIRVVRPDGSTAYFNISPADGETKLVLKNAANGKYSVDVATGSKTQATYEASAEMAGAAPAPQPSSTPAPSPAPAPAPQPAAPAPAEDFNLTVKAPKIKARRARKGAKVKVGVTVSREVQSVTATLKKGKKKLGAGKLARLTGSGNVTVKLAKKLKAGRYTVTVAARDARGVVVARTVAVKVAR
jgi:hypothetical protein